MAHARRKEKKLKKKKEIQKSELTLLRSFGPQSHLHPVRFLNDAYLISVDDVIEMGQALGVSFNGPKAKLKKQIANLLSAQKADCVESQI